MATTALVTPTVAPAGQVTLKSADGQLSVDGDLLSHDATTYTIETQLGTIALEKSLVSCEGPGCPAAPAPAVTVATNTPAASDPTATVLPDGPVTLTSANGSLTLNGTLKSFDGQTYVIVTQLGTMPVDSALVSCEGPGCPIEQVQTIAVRGSDTIGDALMPLLVSGYVSATGGTIMSSEQIAGDTTRLSVAPNQGSGAAFDVEIQAAGSSAGMSALISRSTDIAMASRDASAQERQAIRQQGRGDLESLQQNYILALDSILTVVHPDNPVQNLTMRQLADAMAGRINNWAELGGPDLPINVYTRPGGSGTRAVVNDKVLAPLGLTMRPDAIEVSGNGDMQQLVESDPSALGYLSFNAQGDTKSLDLVASCGITMSPTVFASKTEEYPLERRLHLYVDNAPLAPEAQGLLDFAVSPAADPLMRDAGFIDLSVKVATPEETSARQFADKDAKLGREELQVIGQMLSQLDGAARLSTTLRFEIGSEQLDVKSQRDIVRVMEYLSKPEMAGKELILAGFSDATGPFEANRVLSDRRASAALAALQRHPLAANLPGVTMSAAGFSELSPVGCNTSEDGRSRNRRVELWLR